MFKSLDDRVLVAAQIGEADVALAAEQGVTLIINNRPDDEAPDQVNGAQIEAAAHQAGILYLAIPVTHAGFSLPQVDAMATALSSAQGKVLAYCRSGTRSTLLWALAQASRGETVDGLSAKAARAGYDLTPIRTMLDMASGRS
ncbi:MAG: TIGR01244 family sulfur transferase [Sphingomonadaceae bacterium]